ncbi:MAG: exosortase T [Pseudomonadota bacterium]
MERVQTHASTVSLAIASIILAVEPFRWLVRSWQEPAYQSYGHWYAAALVGLILASLRSGPARAVARSDGLILIFLGAALLRLLGQVFAVNILAALALAVDVYAIARWLRLDLRPLALSPLWLAAFFLFALPLAPILERVMGFPLQMVSAELSCAMLGPFFSDLECEGVRLKIETVDVMVDLPCSGATGLLLMLTLWTVMNARLRPSIWCAARGLVYVVVAALVGNGLRISLLAAGLAHGIDTMAPLLHDAIGLVSLAAAAGPVLLLYRPATRPARGPAFRVTLPTRVKLPLAVLAVGAALMIVSAPKDPIDRSGQVARVDLPAQLLGFGQTPEPLTEFEQAYFVAYGGAAQKASYGALGLNIVQTGSPLRHLHSPATCLLGMGYDVIFLGTRFDPVPTSVYRATSPDGAVWMVSVSFVSDAGHRTASVGEAVWSWLSGRSSTWMSVQRITPYSLPPEARAAFEHAALAALDL